MTNLLGVSVEEHSPFFAKDEPFIMWLVSAIEKTLRNTVSAERPPRPSP